MKFVDAVYCTTLANNKNNEIFVAISRGIPAMQIIFCGKWKIINLRE